MNRVPGVCQADMVVFPLTMINQTDGCDTNSVLESRAILFICLSSRAHAPPSSHAIPFPLSPLSPPCLSLLFRHGRSERGGVEQDTGIASEEEWNISLQNAPLNESGLNEDGSSWYRESGEDVGENGYRCRWSIMGGRSSDGSVQWKETWWEKSDWTGYKEL
ncbi:unnamed protein product, partial [Closterium sp. Naga37s-1]